MVSLFMALACTGDKDPGWNLADGDACISCHTGIEQAHGPIDETECTDCHGGDETSTDKSSAHVAVPSNYNTVRGNSLFPAPDGYIKDMPPDMLDQLSESYIRFINPGDIRVAEESCGGDCHGEIVDFVKTSIMTTNAGHYWPTRYYAGIQDQNAMLGSVAVTDPDWSGAPGTVQSLQTLSPPSYAEFENAQTDDDLEQVALDHYLSKNCSTCHASGYPRNNSRATYRSTGCTSCHVLYDISGVYQGDDDAMPKNIPVYPARHEITSDITVEQCATCHYQGGRIGFLFRGIREGGFATVPEYAELWNDSVYTHVPGYYIFDEDTTNSIDETPPDLHYTAGMVCADCHVGSDVHGDGRIYSSSKGQVDLRCEDCHGTVRQKSTPDDEGVFRTSSGRPLTQLYLNSSGKVSLMSRGDGQEHTIPQPADILPDQHEDSQMVHAMAPNENDWSHTDSLTCDTCHTSWTQQCLGCHVNLDMRLSQTDYQTGIQSTGLTSGKRDTYDLGIVILCQAPDGRAQSCQSSQQLQLSIVDEQGTLVYGEEELDSDNVPTGNFTGQFRQTQGYESVIGWANFYQHTTSKTPRNCNSCHRENDSAEEWTRVKGVYGHGTGEYMLTSPDGSQVDALQFLDDNGNQITPFAHPETGPLSEPVRQRAMDVDLSEQ